MSTRPKVSVVIPTFQSAQHLAASLQAIADEAPRVGSTEIVVVDDGSTDESFQVALTSLRSLRGISFVAIELAKNVGQTPATAIGLSHASGEIVISVDDDLSYPPTNFPTLIKELTEELDFVVGAPAEYANSVTRGVASRLVRWMAVRTLDTPRDFVFSSLVAYRREFLQRVDIASRQIEEIGWMFRFTDRYRNVVIDTQASLRRVSSYRLRTLLKTVRPVTQFLLQTAGRTVRWISASLVLLTLLISGIVLIKAINGTDFLPGFPTVVIAILLNIAISSLLLSFGISLQESVRKQRGTTVFLMQRRVVRG